MCAMGRKERIASYLSRVLGDPVDIEVKRGVGGRRASAPAPALGRLGLGSDTEGACGGRGVGERSGEQGVDESTPGGSAELADDESHLGSMKPNRRMRMGM